MPRQPRPIVIGLLCAIPVALLAGWFATEVFDPATTDPHNVVNALLGLGPLRGVAFGVGALLSAAIVAPQLAREDVGSYGGLFRYVLLAHLIAFSGAALEIIVRDPSSLDPSIILNFPFGWLVTLGASMIVWVPAGAVWVAAVRSLTIEDLPVPTDLERAQSEAMRNEAAREHVIVDATTVADQGSRLYRNRG